MGPVIYSQKLPGGDDTGAQPETLGPDKQPGILEDPAQSFSPAPAPSLQLSWIKVYAIERALRKCTYSIVPVTTHVGKDPDLQWFFPLKGPALSAPNSSASEGSAGGKALPRKPAEEL